MTNSTMSVLAIEKAVSVLRSGGVIALPTDTLYALAAAARDAEAVRRVFAIKGREGAKPLPLFVSDLAMAERVAVTGVARAAMTARATSANRSGGRDPVSPAEVL